MAQEIRSFTVTVPAGTAIDAGWTYPLDMPPRIVETISVRVPPGPRGTVGFQIGSSGQQIIPYQEGEWVVTDDDKIEWPLDNQIDSGAWELYAYNDGDFPHTLYIRFAVDPVTNSTPTPTTQPLVINQ